MTRAKSITIESMLSTFDTWCLCDKPECAKSQSYKLALKEIETLIKECLPEEQKGFNGNTLSTSFDNYEAGFNECLLRTRANLLKILQ